MNMGYIIESLIKVILFAISIKLVIYANEKGVNKNIIIALVLGFLK
jgi:hypothetical protein